MFLLSINKRKLGSLYEEKAASYLQSRGLQILEKNYRCKLGEIDLIAKDGNCIVFAEVKYRYNMKQGYAAEAVDRRKQMVLKKVAEFYLLAKIHSLDVPCRFDVIGFDGEKIHWISNAFDV